MKGQPARSVSMANNMFSPVGRLAVGLVLLSAPLWAGKEFTQGPSEQAVPNQILVKFRPGALPGPVISSLLPGAQIVPLNLNASLPQRGQIEF